MVSRPVSSSSNQTESRALAQAERFLTQSNWNFNYVHCRTYYDYPNKVKPNKDKKRSKMYINLNRIPKAHRIRLMMRLVENNLEFTGYNSLMCFPPGVRKLNKILLNDMAENQPIEKFSRAFPKENKENIRQINKLLPITADFTESGDEEFNYGHLLSGPSKFVNDSYFSIVT